MAFLRKKREEPRVDLTPMVDVVFNLLIFFMISTTFVETSGLDIKLPKTGSLITEKAPEEVKVFLSREGEISFRGEILSLTELRVRLTEMKAEAAARTFVLEADRDARHGQVVTVMDLAREAGFGRLAIATEPGGPVREADDQTER